ncbi:HlyD family secretion protein [Shuttleworthella sp. MSX8B]|uniref:efflux RND transporter periplasmic adaptor subunit n=1 Tax=Shuttleworthella sp. MSX8B TaxID=936574 RepID=UPI0004500787|nr:efflux RND transporter periplasmic adaptor subunit [Shuttleworthia sp. MSX8B]EUB17070.1 HlyD family secretion protein [Shuttleworthia sp. MSX8B]
MKARFIQFWKKHRKLLVFLIIVLALVIAAIVRAQFGKKAADKEPKTETISRRTIVKSVTGSGKVTSVQSQDLTSDLLASPIKTVNVKVGDRVRAGQLIAQMDTSRLEASRDSLKEQIRSARQAQKETETQLAQQAAQAKQSQLQGIEEKLEEVRSRKDQAEKSLSQAQDKLKRDLETGSGADAATLAADRVQVEQSQAALTALQAQETALQAQLEALENAPSADLSSLGNAGSSVTESSISSLQNQLDQLQQQIDKGAIRASMDGLVTQVKAEAGKTYSGGTIARIEDDSSFQILATVAEADIPDVQAGMAVKVKTDATGEAELDGNVTAVAPAAGSSSSGTGLGGLGSIGGLDLGSLSGLGDLAGASSGSSSSGFTVTIALPAGNDRLRLGMNADVSIITSSAPDALSVPFESVQKAEDGSSFIEIIEHKKTGESGDKKQEEISVRRIAVTTGLEGTYYTQIVSDQVQEGMQVVVPETKSDNSVNQLLNSMGAGGGVN